MAPEPDLSRYRYWFLAAALYNLGFGAFVVLFPTVLLDAVGVEPPSVIGLWQAAGMTVLVFAPAYFWAYRDPWAHRYLVLIGTLGKVLGLAGFVFGVVSGQLPVSFGWISLFNEVIWLPAFLAFLYRVGQTTGWRRLVLGD